VNGPWLALAVEARARVIAYLAVAEPSEMTAVLRLHLATLDRVIAELERGRAA
jgi:hypothetical protein